MVLVVAAMLLLVVVVVMVMVVVEGVAVHLNTTLSICTLSILSSASSTCVYMCVCV
jgi:hypothetical protein